MLFVEPVEHPLGSGKYSSGAQRRLCSGRTCIGHVYGGQEELPHVRCQGQRPRVPDCDGVGTAERSYPASEVKGGNERSYPRPPSLEARGSGREELPHARGQGHVPVLNAVLSQSTVVSMGNSTGVGDNRVIKILGP